LEKAVQIDPDGLDANFFYGDFLFGRKEYAKSITVLEHALAAPELAQRPIADQGRRKEIRETIKAARAKLS
jgi:Tfp pilus assembly protein PilF